MAEDPCCYWTVLVTLVDNVQRSARSVDGVPLAANDAVANVRCLMPDCQIFAPYLTVRADLLRARTHFAAALPAASSLTSLARSRARRSRAGTTTRIRTGSS